MSRETVRARASDAVVRWANEWRLALHKQFDEAHESTKLPDRPDYVWANDYLIRCRKSMLKA
ncbi:MAG: hypothetical protein IPG59_01775 [Candidatus Melainabacteria bacterium]|nr:MAG: hypothetical protein IPG59_01775 [Candidatus Melainabacteria bacterium]